ncbi:hypothetical protein [Coriobacterium glomerans]|uniref:hypothetical protein n=1 Tax=Coriobacterium glomerans TaxID=33871 RepID=UPI00155A718A|nr:hypothetical protein [Coriobacterium glomerans]
MSGSRRQMRPVVHAALALCCAVALAALLAVARGRPGRDDGASRAASGEATPAAAAGEGHSIDTSSDSFLDDLADATGVSREPSEKDGRQNEITASWTERLGLSELATKVLCAYRDHPSSELVSSGFMDIEGNVWAALVRDPHGWVDIVTVSSGDDDSVAMARVVRLLPSDAFDGGSR